MHAHMLLIQNYPLVPAPANVRVTYPMRVIAGSLTNLTCTVELSPSVDVPVNISTEWSGPERIMFLPDKLVPAMMMNITAYTSTITIDAARNGTYTCQATISSGGMMSGSASVTVGMCPPPYFFPCTQYCLPSQLPSQPPLT